MNVTFRTLTACLIIILLTGNFCHLYGQSPSPPPLTKQFSINNSTIQSRLAFLNSGKPDTTNSGSINPLGTDIRVNSFSAPVLPESFAKPGAALKADFDYPLNDCFTYTYKLSLSTPVGETTVNETFTASDGSAYIIGFVLTGAGQKQGLVKKLDHDANIVWSRSLTQTGRNTTIQSIRELANGNLILIGTTEIGVGTSGRILLPK